MDADFDGIIPWPLVRTYLERELHRIRDQMDTMDGPELYRLQGYARCLKACLNLPAAITVTTEDESA